MPPSNLHGTAVVLADRGVLITGRSGAGKTSLAIALIEAARSRGHLARLVADDQLYTHVHSTMLAVEAPRPLRGLVEIYGIGPIPTPWEECAMIDLVVDLVSAEAAPRYQEDQTRVVAGVAVPGISVAERNVRSAVPAICARLGL